MQILKGHVSPETAYVVNDYPYGFRLRCTIRYWLDVNKTHGVRLVTQTTNPKRGHTWNQPKQSTYSRFGGCMYLTDDPPGHVAWSGLSEYSDLAETAAWIEKYGEGNVVPEKTRLWHEAQKRYAEARARGKAMNEAAVEAALGASLNLAAHEAGIPLPQGDGIVAVDASKLEPQQLHSMIDKALGEDY